MADRTYADLVLEALHDDFEPTKYTAKAQQAINDGIREIGRRVDLPLLDKVATVNLVAGTSSYALPTDLVRLKALTDANANPLEELPSIDAFDALSTASRGTPTGFVFYGANLLVWPTPSAAAALTLRYRAAAPSFAGDTTAATSVFPDEYAHLLVSFARARLFRFEDDPQMATYWQGEFDRGVALLRGDIQSRTRSLRRVGDGRLVRRPSFQRP